MSAVTEDRFIKRLAAAMYEIAAQHKHQAALARLKELVMPEVESAARYDVQAFWVPKILRAIERGKTSVTNRWLGSGRSDKEYREAMQEVLGPPFVVLVDESLLAGDATRVWWA